MKIETSKLEGGALDWAVALIDDREMALYYVEQELVPPLPESYSYSTDWSIAACLIEERITRIDTVRDCSDERFIATTGGWPMGESRGKTMLIAAMRAIVASELGDTVDVPDELLT